MCQALPSSLPSSLPSPPSHPIILYHLHFTLSPLLSFSLHRELGLRNPIFQKTACYGHFGRPEFTWEQPKKLVLWITSFCNSNWLILYSSNKAKCVLIGWLGVCSRLTSQVTIQKLFTNCSVFEQFCSLTLCSRSNLSNAEDNPTTVSSKSWCTKLVCMDSPCGLTICKQFH